MKKKKIDYFKPRWYSLLDIQIAPNVNNAPVMVKYKGMECNYYSDLLGLVSMYKKQCNYLY